MGALIICVDPAGPRHNTGIAVFHGTSLLLAFATKVGSMHHCDIIDDAEEQAHTALHANQGNGDSPHCHRRSAEGFPLLLDVTWFVEEPGAWMAGAKTGKSWRSLVVLQRAIGAWIAVTGATPVADDVVKAALTGDRHAAKGRVQWVLKALGYQFHENNEADAIALGHYMANKLTLETRAAPEVK